MCSKSLLLACSLAVILLCHDNCCEAAGFIWRKGVKFLKDDGKSFHLNGFNAYWLMMFGANPSTKFQVSTTFANASKFGLNVARTMAFNDGGNMPLQKSPGIYDENMFKGLDFVVSEAKKNGIYLILALVNNWPSLGGRKQYVDWAKQRGANVNDEDDFYTNPIVKEFYKNHVKTVLTRVNTITGVAYKDEPTIFAWDLMNEPHCQSDPSGKAVQGWVEEMTSYLKSIDKNHLVEVGLEGFYGESKKQSNPSGVLYGTDFISIGRIPSIDYATIHNYPDTWFLGSNSSLQTAFAIKWIQEHAEDSKSIFGKPLVVGEFGKSSRLVGYSIEERNKFFSTVYNTTYSCATGTGACAGALFWQLLGDGMDSYGDGFEVVFGRSPSTDAIILDQSRKMSAFVFNNRFS